MKTLLAALTLVITPLAAFASDVEDTRTYTDGDTGLTLVGGSVELPFQGHWILTSPISADGALQDCRLEPPQAVQRALYGRRHGQLEEKREIQRGAYPLRRLYWDCHQYAQRHQGYGPPSIQDLPSPSLQYQDKDICYVPSLQLLTDVTNRW